MLSAKCSPSDLAQPLQFNSEFILQFALLIEEFFLYFLTLFLQLLFLLAQFLGSGPAGLPHGQGDLRPYAREFGLHLAQINSSFGIDFWQLETLLEQIGTFAIGQREAESLWSLVANYAYAGGVFFTGIESVTEIADIIDGFFIHFYNDITGVKSGFFRTAALLYRAH